MILVNIVNREGRDASKQLTDQRNKQTTHVRWPFKQIAYCWCHFAKTTPVIKPGVCTMANLCKWFNTDLPDGSYPVLKTHRTLKSTWLNVTLSRHHKSIYNVIRSAYIGCITVWQKHINTYLTKVKNANTSALYNIENIF